jgi:hypothetical protein
MLWLSGRQLSYVAAVIGLFFVAAGVTELATRRSRLNGLLGVNSFHRRTNGVTLLEEALQPEALESRPPPAPPPHAGP